MLVSLILAPIARPVLTACSTHLPLITGSMPGIAASTSETWVLGSAPNAVAALENSLESLSTWACTSSPMMTSHLPVPLSIRLLIARAFARRVSRRVIYRRSGGLAIGMEAALGG